jgi:hypothetical protein
MKPEDGAAYPRRVSATEWKLLALTFALALGLAIPILSDFGQATDEYTDFVYAANALRAYAGNPHFIGRSFEELYGPFHLMLAELFSRAAGALVTTWTATDGRHLANFVVFLLGAAGVYLLLRRDHGPFSSGLAAALFATQPMLLGHGFINEKDTPFMAYFVLSVAIGLYAVDTVAGGINAGRRDPSSNRSPGRMNTAADLSRDVARRMGWRRLPAVIVAIVLLVASAMLLTGVVLLPVAESILAQAYGGTAAGPIQRAFDSIATDAYKTPLSDYLDKFHLIYAWMKVPLAAAGLGLAAVLGRQALPNAWLQLTRRLPKRWILVAAAGVVFGLTNSIRVAAPMAGFLVALYMLVMLGRRGGWLLVVYALAAATTSYLTWPWLWRSPIANYWQSLLVMSRFPAHKVLFDGVVYASTQIPLDYIPRLIAIQTTEVVLPLFVLGLGFGLRRMRGGGRQAIDRAIWIVWFGLPLLVAMILRTPLYGNLRQTLFMLPPVFLIAGDGIDWLASRLRTGLWRVGLVLVILMPGVAGSVVLHPYEDSYFNGWVGWTSGAYGRYQVDPWCTSYREAARFLNAAAPDGAIVNVRGPFQSVEDFTDARLVMRPDYDSSPKPDYALMCQIDELGDGFDGSLPVLHRITRGRAVLAVIRGVP